MHPRARMKPRALSERGASAVEYALILAGIAAVVVLVIFLLGSATSGLFQDTCDSFNDAGAASCS
ncbi:MAG: Flp family type IVb pilin [Nocardioides sp.]|nr:Flp family type IVb pilin [Nocardioides sp.]